MNPDATCDTAFFEATKRHNRFDEAYPPRLRAHEHHKVQQRREAAGAESDTPLVGVALSGGGIRSATFCLGLFQALARHRLLGRIDFLSTVSGGGYFGSFLGALFQRETTPGTIGVEEALADSNSWPVRWLRENGRFLSPNGAGDTWTFAAAMLRNWVAVQIVLATLLLMLLCLAALARSVIWEGVALYAGRPGATPFYEAWLAAHPLLSIWWSPYVLGPMLTFALLMVPTGWLYWLTQGDTGPRLLRRLFSWRDATWKTLSEDEVRQRLQNALTRALSASLVLTLGLLAFAVVDSLGQTLYARWVANGYSFPSTWAGLTATGAVAFGLAQKIFVLLEKLPKRRAVRLPTSLVALLAALTWAALILVGLSVAAHALAWRLDPPWDEQLALRPMNGAAPLAGAVVIAGVLSWVFSTSFGFVNLSSHQQLYAARLKRAYIGASNPQRRNEQNYNLTDPLSGDEIAFDEYHPYQHGGPLHLINVTVNETLSGKSQIEQRDRKGLSLAVGPCGLSVGTRDHALWFQGSKAVEPLVSGARFHALHGDRPPRTLVHRTRKAGPESGKHPVETLGLGHWIAVSGAAFTTGLGQSTTLGLSLLLGLANARLGYWWDSGVLPEQRTQRTKPRFSAQLGELFARLLPVQAALFDELLARFHGPARKHWYLSDGGHFENTACYELVRRRLPFIIASDAGRDMNYDFADLANLARKVRTDFGAEIELARRRSPQNPAQSRDVRPMPALEDLVHPELLKVIGAPEDFVPVPGAADATEATNGERPAYAARHALLARVWYPDTNEFSWIVFLKPSLTGDEAMDVVQYQKAQPDFPQESTMDQYFDEAQWESYRKLGEHIGALVFARPSSPPATGAAAWSPSAMHPPPVALHAGPPSTAA